ncbi:MAG: histidine phosphotransferase family protein [Pseudomonadota bacterium]|nr:histidine phosphotransferase family protein [Pseudomonadota bacterium]
MQHTAAGPSAPDTPEPANAPRDPQVSAATVSAPDLAAQLAGRLCHDFISPASAINSGLDLLDDPTAGDMREEAMSLIADSARKLVALLAFSRVAFGASATAENFAASELHTLVQGIYSHMRPELDWAVSQPHLTKPAARALLNMAQIAGTAFPSGGVIRLSAEPEGDRVRVEALASGPRNRMRAEVATGLRGEALTEGLGGPWVQAYYLHALVARAEGRLEFDSAEDRLRITARLPA